MPQARQTGKTTKQALDAIAWVLKNPNQLYNIKDHHNTQAATRELCNLIKSTVDVLGLKYIELNPYTHQMKYVQPNQTYIELYESGKELQYYEFDSDSWVDCDPLSQGFPNGMRFRVKPELKRWVFQRLNGTCGVTEAKFLTKSDAQLALPGVEIIGEFVCKN